MKQNLSDRYKTSGVVKPGATTKTLIVSGKSEIRELTDKDIIVFWGGANDVSTNNTQEGLKHIVNFIQTNKHANIILVSVPNRYDLPDWSCVNSEVGTFNRKLMKLTRPFKHVKVVQVDLELEFYTKHGQHMTKESKDKVALKVAQAATNVLHEQTREPISLYWKTDQVNEGNQVPREDRSIIQGELAETALDMEVDASSAATCEESAEEVKRGFEDLGQHLNKKGNVYEVQLHGGSVAEGTKPDNPSRPTRTKKVPKTKTEDCYGKTKWGASR
jgi:hypothetical protein